MVRQPSACTESHDPRFDVLELFNAELELLAEGFRWLEGPVWFGDLYGSRLFLYASTALYALFTGTRRAVAC